MKKSIFLFFAAILCAIGMNAETYRYSGEKDSWTGTQMTVSVDGYYSYYGPVSGAHQFKIGTSSNQWAYNHSYVSKEFNNTDINDIGDYGGDNAFCWYNKSHYILVYHPKTTINSENKVKICASTFLPDDRECYLMGVDGDWTTGIKMMLNSKNSNEFMLLDQPIKDPIKFKIKGNTDTWTDQVENYNKNGVTWEEGNIVLPAGNYDFYFKKDIMKVYIARNTVVTTTANPAEGGTLTGAGVYNNDDDVTLTATPNTGYNFVNWTQGGTQVSADATYAFKAAGDVEYVANFELKTYTVKFLNYDGEVLQSTTVNHGETPVYSGKTPERPADAQYTYTFSGWDNAIAAATGDQTYKAQFNTTVNQYTITVNTENGTVIGAGTYDYGTNVTLTATAEEGYEFTGWSNGKTANPYTFEVTEDITLTANFDLKSYTITATAENGTVTGAGTYDHGANVTLTATANEGYKFVNWTKGGVEVSTDATYTFTATEDAEFVANFKATTITLTTGDNSAVIAANIGETVNVKIERSFTANDGYYTLCVPFNMDPSVIGKAYSLGTITEHVAGEGININLEEETYMLSAGVPYLVLPKANMSELVVENVTIQSDIASGQNVTGGEGLNVQIFFEGFYSASGQTNGSTEYYVGDNGYLYNGIVDKRGLCGLFTITDKNGDPLKVRARVVTREDAATGFENITNSENTTIKLIENGQLIIIRNGEKFNAQGVRF